MKRRIDVDDAIGKTVHRFIYSMLSNHMVISFTDDTFIAFTAEQDPHEGDIDISPYPKFDVLHSALGLDKLVEAEILTADEYNDMYAKYCAEVDKERERAELAQYHNLKKKYE